MAQAVTDFLKYAGFLDLLNRPTAVTFVVVGLVFAPQRATIECAQGYHHHNGHCVRDQ